MEGMLCVNYAVLPDAGEDSFALRKNGPDAWLCVADGCGGLGARRYEALDGRTGAYLAARLATGAFDSWAQACWRMPHTPDDGQAVAAELSTHLHGVLAAFAHEHCSSTTRIVGSMQRSLPTTFCAAFTAPVSQGTDVCFVWAGDSRGYVLDEHGLHQYTQDHLRGTPDPFESLYRDVPLGRLLCADHPAPLDLRRTQISAPCVVITATDGAYGCLRTPMEFEMLLLTTLMTAISYESWQKKLTTALKKLANDDATLLMQPCGFADFEQLKQRLLPRREVLQKSCITPVRRRKGDIAFARDKWRMYRDGYDRTQGGQHERPDWRI